MEEGENHSTTVWYCLRGPGLICLCFLLFLAGMHMGNQKTIPVNSAVNETELPIYRVQTERRAVALTFDTAGGSKNIDTILKILEMYGVKATFFVTDDWVEQYPDLVKTIAAAGHELGNSGKSRSSMSELSGVEQELCLTEVHKKVAGLTGTTMRLFRPVYGDTDREVLSAAKRCGYLPVLWSIDSMDWKNYGADDMVRTVTGAQELQNGAIIRLHTEASCTAPGLEPLVERLQELGYELVPVSQLMDEK